MRLDDSRLNEYTSNMTGKVQAEIKQKKPFRLREEEAFVNLLRTVDVLLQGVAERLKPQGLSPTQYNVLRILRGAEPEGLACRGIGERMISRDPDVTRLLDRLEDRGLVARTRGREDRRVVTTRITDDGLRILGKLEAPIADLHARQLGHLGAARLRTLIDLLEQARNKVR
jgi:DNA-binding MarR family transcriptional regulator